MYLDGVDAAYPGWDESVVINVSFTTQTCAYEHIHYYKTLYFCGANMQGEN